MLYRNIKFSENGVKFDESIADSLEYFWGKRLPADYKKFLCEINGGDPDESHSVFKINDLEGYSNVRMFFGIVPNKWRNIFCTHHIPINTLAIGCDDCGNLILISVYGKDRGKVYFWDHENQCNSDGNPDYRNMILLANSFNDFLDSLHE